MPATFTWTAELECVNVGELVNVARTMHWRCTGVLAGLDLAVSGSRPLGDPSPDNFVPAPEEITSAVVRAWMGEDADEVETGLAAALAAKEAEPQVARFVVPIAGE